MGTVNPGRFAKGAANKWASSRVLPLGGACGDSITSPDAGGGGTNILKGVNGYMAWALVLCGQRVKCPVPAYTQGNPSQETSVILANLPAMIAAMPRKPGFMVIECGTNNIYHDAAGTGVGSFASITGDWLAIANYLISLGIRVIFVPILPRGAGFSTLFTAAQFNVMDRCNRWLMNFSQQSSMVAVASDCLQPMTDPASVGAQPKTGMMYDGTHPGTRGAYYIGKAIARILSAWFPPLDVLPYNNLAYSASSPTANLLVNGMMEGTGGVVSAAASGTATGQAATSWTADNNLAAGLTATHSLVTSAISGTRMHQIAFTGSHTVAGSSAGPTFGYYSRIRQSAAQAALAAGDRIEALIAFEIDAGQQGLAFPQLQMRWKGSSNYNTDMHSSHGELPNEAIAGVLRTPEHLYLPTEFPLNSGDLMMLAFAHLKSYPDGAVTDGATIRFGRAVIQKVAD
jgi:hypothetical protein